MVESLKESLKHRVENQEGNIIDLIKDIKVIAFKKKVDSSKRLDNGSCSWSSCHCATYKGNNDPKYANKLNIDDLNINSCSWSTCHCATYKK